MMVAGGVAVDIMLMMVVVGGSCRGGDRGGCGSAGAVVLVGWSGVVGGRGVAWRVVVWCGVVLVLVLVLRGVAWCVASCGAIWYCLVGFCTRRSSDARHRSVASVACCCWNPSRSPDLFWPEKHQVVVVVVLVGGRGRW